MTTAKHTCGGPVFGRKTAGCPRCDELLAGAQQPAGYVICWGLLPSYVEAVQARQPDPSKWEIQTFQPTGVS